MPPTVGTVHAGLVSLWVVRQLRSLCWYHPNCQYEVDKI